MALPNHINQGTPSPFLPETFSDLLPHWWNPLLLTAMTLDPIPFARVISIPGLDLEKGDPRSRLSNLVPAVYLLKRGVK